MELTEMIAIAFLLFAALVLAWLAAPSQKAATTIPHMAPALRPTEAAA
jgi:hypothetical protein